MAGTLGTITGQVRIDVSQAIAAYAALRAANIGTLLALRSASTTFVAAGAAMAGAGLAIASGFVYAIKAAADFERQLDFFGAVSNSTAAEMEAVRAKALQLGQDTIYSSKQVAEAFVELGKAGVSAKDIIDGVGEAVTSLGAAGDIPLDKAANIITSAVQTFKLGAEDATHVADLLAGAANASIVDIDDLGVSLKYVGGVAASISLPIEDVVDALSLLGKAGIRGSTAGTSLRQILVSLTGTSAKASKTLKELGIITKDGTNLFFNAKGQAKPLADIFQILQEKTAGLTEAQRLAAFKIIFNNRALAAANILARDGAKGFAEMNKEISKTTAADVAAKRLDNLSGDVERLKSALEVLAIDAGSPFQQFLRTSVQALTNLVNAFNNLSPSTQKIIFYTLALSAALLIVLGSISLVIGALFKMGANMLLLRGAIAAVIRILAAFRIAAVTAWLAALGPIGIIIAAVLLLAAAFVFLWMKSETFRNAVKAVGAAIVTAFWAVVNFFRGPFVNAMVTAWNAVVTAFNAAKDALIAAWNAVVTFFVTIGTAIKNALVTSFNAVVAFFAALPGRILTFIVFLVTTIINTIRTLPEAIAYTLGFILGLFVRIWINIFNFTSALVQSLVTAIINFFVALPGRIQAILSAIHNAFIAAWTAVRNFAISVSQAIVNGVISFFQQLPARLAAIWNRVRSAAVSAWNATKAAVVAAAKALVSSVISFIQQLPGRIKAAFEAAKKAATTAFTSLKTTVVGIAKSIPGAVLDALGSLAGVVKQAFERAISAVSGLGGAAYNKAKSIGSSLWKGFKDGMGIHSPSFIEKAMFAVHDTMVDEIGFLGKMVRRAQAIGGNLLPVQRTITGVQQARARSIEATSGTVAGPAGLEGTPTGNEAILAKLDELIEALQNIDGNTYLDGKKVDAAMSATALAAGYWNTRD